MGDAINSADDIRALGWAVAVHNDYRLDGVRHTFWLFTKGDKCVKGEGHTDGEALNEVRAQLQNGNSYLREVPEEVMDALAELKRTSMGDAAVLRTFIEEQQASIVTLRCALACSTCLWKPTPDEPCPHRSKCCYALKTGIGEGENNFWSGVEGDLP